MKKIIADSRRSGAPVRRVGAGIDAILGAAQVACDTGDIAQATTLLEQAVKINPENVTARFALALIHQRASRWHDAIAQFEVVLQLDPTHEGAMLNLGFGLFRAGQTERAMRLYDQLVCTTDQEYGTWFDDKYREGLLQTTCNPFPLSRRPRFFHLVELLEKTLGLDGAIAECGCFLGLSTFMLASRVKMHTAAYAGENFHVFDSFAGLSKPTDADFRTLKSSDRVFAMCKEGEFAADEQCVRHNLRDFPALTFHKGWIPDSFTGLSEAKYRFVHVDVDLHQPTRASLEYFFPRLCDGGIIVSDDYNWPGARQAIDEFAAAYRLDLHTTPTHQAFIVKMPRAKK